MQVLHDEQDWPRTLAARLGKGRRYRVEQLQLADAPTDRRLAVPAQVEVRGNVAHDHGVATGARKQMFKRCIVALAATGPPRQSSVQANVQTRPRSRYTSVTATSSVSRLTIRQARMAVGG